MLRAVRLPRPGMPRRCPTGSPLSRARGRGEGRPPGPLRPERSSCNREVLCYKRRGSIVPRVARFTIRAPAPLPAGVADSPRPPLAARRAILCIRDRRSRTVLQKSLRRLHVRAQLARGVDETVKLLGQRDAFLVLADVRPPGGTMHELLEKVRATRPTTQTVLVASRPFLGQAFDGVKAGAMEALLRPVDPDMAEIVVERALAHRAREREIDLLKREVRNRNGADGHAPGRAPSGPASGWEGRSLEELVHARLQTFVEKLNLDKMEGLHALVLEQVERPLLRLVLERTRFHQIRAARILGINRNTLRRKMADLKVRPAH